MVSIARGKLGPVQSRENEYGRLSKTFGILTDGLVNRPFARSGHMVRNK